jgi:hypothetical protein
MTGSAENGTPAHNADVFKDCHGEDDDTMIVIHIRPPSDPAHCLSIFLHCLPRGHPLLTTHTSSNTAPPPLVPHLLTLPRWDPQPLGDMQNHLSEGNKIYRTNDSSRFHADLVPTALHSFSTNPSFSAILLHWQGGLETVSRACCSSPTSELQSQHRVRVMLLLMDGCCCSLVDLGLGY